MSSMEDTQTPHIFIGADHGGFELKELLKQRLQQSACQLTDCGAHSHDGEDDYPTFAFAVAQAVRKERAAGRKAFGILVCRSSGGMTIAANKVPGIRAVSVDSLASARHAREHNDAHVASISGDWIVPSVALELVETFLKTPFASEARHLRRIEQIAAFEEAVTIQP
jgi:ribose 5-phosphate isomerase B